MNTVYEHTKTFFTKFPCGFCKAHSKRHALLFDCIMNLSNAYDVYDYYLPHNLFITKLKTYGATDYSSLTFMLDDQPKFFGKYSWLNIKSVII